MGPLSNPAPTSPGRTCWRRWCEGKWAGDRWVDNPNAPGGGYWEGLCAKHLAEQPESQHREQRDGNQQGQNKDG